MKRLKNYYKKQRNAKPEKKSECTSLPRQDYFVVIDFEGTCEKKTTTGYIHEIIEFPAILVNARTLELVCYFVSFILFSHPFLHKLLARVTILLVILSPM
jgi:3'-5' exoribonuclease 1